MSKKVFISYSHQQGEWVWNRLVPCLRAGGAEVLIDRERFEVGKTLYGQMDAVQDTADASVLVLSPQFLSSAPCCHEMERAIALDPRFERGSVIPVIRQQCPLPDLLKGPNPLYVDLRKDHESQPWDLLLSGCGADLGTDAPHWLAVSDDLQRLLERGQSVNLLVLGDKVVWRPLVARLQLPRLGIVDLQPGRTASRRLLVREILRSLGARGRVPPEPEDLAELDRVLDKSERSWLALTHSDLVPYRNYGVDLFAALRYHLTESRRLVLLIQSHKPFATLLPEDHPLSNVDVKTVELRGRK